VHVHVDRIVTIAPADAEPAADAGPRPEHGSRLVVTNGTGTTSFEVDEYLLFAGPPGLKGFLHLTDLAGMPIKINPGYVILVRAHQPSGTVLEVHGTAGTDVIVVREDLDSVGNWWAEFARRSLADPGAHW
jgi:hypothetical protein